MLYPKCMKRTQLQVDETTWEVLRERAFRERRSIAEVVREILKADVARITRKRPTSAFSFIGSGASRGRGRGRVSERHDEELMAAFRK